MKEKKLDVVFISNYYTHHQKSLSDALNSKAKSYCFIETDAMEQERLLMGWGNIVVPKYVVSKEEYTRHETAYNKCILDADLVIWDSCSPIRIVEERLKCSKITFCFAERLYRPTYQFYKFIKRIPNMYAHYGRYKSFYLLAVGAFSSFDYSLTGTFLNKSFKFAYFTDFIQYDMDALLAKKNKYKILWVARLIELKHPEYMIKLAIRLKEIGLCCMIEIIGDGPLRESLQTQIDANSLNDMVKILGSISPDEVRKHMEEAAIFTFTSDRNEGWGAVMNEAMNSGCAVVASSVIGSVPFLIEQGKNGFYYEDGDFEDFLSKTIFLLQNESIRECIGYNAYKTIADEWNATIAADRLFQLFERIRKKEKYLAPVENGVCSVALPMRTRWYRRDRQ